MGYKGVNSLDTGEALNVQLARLGFDEVDFTEHLTEGDMATATYWSRSNDLYNSGGGTSITVTNEQDLNLKAFFLGELLDSLQVLTPEANRIMTDNVNNWVNNNLTTFSDAGSWLRTDANSIGLYCKLATAYAPMTEGVEYTMVVKTNGQTWTGPGWSFQDYAGNELFQVTSDPGTSGQEETFNGPVGTAGGFRIASLGDCDVFYWDNFTLGSTSNWQNCIVTNSIGNERQVGSFIKGAHSITTSAVSPGGTTSSEIPVYCIWHDLTMGVGYNEYVTGGRRTPFGRGQIIIFGISSTPNLEC